MKNLLLFTAPKSAAYSSGANLQIESKKLGLSALTALVVGSMIGGGIFSLPQNTAAKAGVGAILIGWSITAVGMLALALVFQRLANRKPNLNGGVYIYAKEGFGNYMGFSSAWGYWISAWLGNVSYLVLLFSALGIFFPIFGDGNTLIAILCESLLLWAAHFLVLRGVKEAAFINTITTISKIIPLFLFSLICFFAFKLDVFSIDVWGMGNPELGSVLHQVRNMMLVTVWVFIGIEGASVFSSRAGKRSDIGKATVIGFIIVLAFLVLVSVLSMGIMTQKELSELKNPSMVLVLEHVVGNWGAILVNIGLLISLLGALLSWMLLCSEILFTTAKDGTMPSFLRKENSKGAPANAIWLTTLTVQAFLIITLFSSSTYITLIYLASSMILIPYFWSAAYALLLCWRGETYEREARSRKKDAFIASVAIIYAIWLLYAGGIKYLLLSSLLYAPGALLFAKARREEGTMIFNSIEKIIFSAIVSCALIAAFLLYTGYLKI